jgi:hypothetical protein
MKHRGHRQNMEGEIGHSAKEECLAPNWRNYDTGALWDKGYMGNFMQVYYSWK